MRFDRSNCHLFEIILFLKSTKKLYKDKIESNRAFLQQNSNKFLLLESRNRENADKLSTLKNLWEL